MATKQILLPLDVTLRLRIAFLERDNALLQARLLVQETESRHQQTIASVLAEAQITLPVPLTRCTFDAEHGALVYEAGDDEVSNGAASMNFAASG